MYIAATCSSILCCWWLDAFYCTADNTLHCYSCKGLLFLGIMCTCNACLFAKTYALSYVLPTARCDCYSYEELLFWVITYVHNATNIPCKTH